MNWFSGNIAEAVALSKAKNATFVVYCEGTDDFSKEFTKLVNDETIRRKLESEQFVAIKVQSDSEAYIQFAQIYQLVPLPSLFFIGKNGTPVEIVTSVTKTIDELAKKIDGVMERVNPVSSPSGSTASADLIANEHSAQNDDNTEIVCENGVCYKRTNISPTKNDPSKNENLPINETQTITNEEKLRRAKELIEKKNKEKEEEETRAAKERELQRRRVGQDLQNFKQRQEENEMKKLQEERKRDKIEEQAARKRILEQIAADKAERAQRFSAMKTTTSGTTETIANSVPLVTSDSSVARIQFKKPDGEIDFKTFGRDETFATVRSYVEETVIAGSGIKDFSLSTTFPRHEFKSEDNNKRLFELGLVPSSVILILSLDKISSKKMPLSTNYGFMAMLTSIFWGVVNPVIAIFSWAKNRISSSWNRNQTGAAKRSNEEELNHNEQAKKRILRFDNQPKASTSGDSTKSGAYKRVGGSGSNIHRLSDNKDSDDENNTWNGNSTQQQ